MQLELSLRNVFRIILGILKIREPHLVNNTNDQLQINYKLSLAQSKSNLKFTL